MHNGTMNSGPTETTPDASWAPLELAGDEAVLPPGIRLADESRPGRQCFVLIDSDPAAAAAWRKMSQQA